MTKITMKVNGQEVNVPLIILDGKVVWFKRKLSTITTVTKESTSVRIQFGVKEKYCNNILSASSVIVPNLLTAKINAVDMEKASNEMYEVLIWLTAVEWTK